MNKKIAVWLKNNYLTILATITNIVIWIITILMICEIINSPNWITILMEVISAGSSIALITCFCVYWYYCDDEKYDNNKPNLDDIFC